MKAYVLATLASITQAAMGPCPTYTSNMAPERLNSTSFGGLWYEYMYTDGFREGKEYECASWNMLLHTPNETHKQIRYEVLHHS